MARGQMQPIRSLFRSRPWLALTLVACALAVKVLVPQGYMAAQGTSAMVTLCSGSGPEMAAITIPLADSGKQDGQGGEHGGHKAPDGTCPFSGLGHAATPGADPVLLLAAIAFVFATGFAVVALPAPRRRAWLSPPLRGPPAIL